MLKKFYVSVSFIFYFVLSNYLPKRLLPHLLSIIISNTTTPLMANNLPNQINIIVRSFSAFIYF